MTENIKEILAPLDIENISGNIFLCDCGIKSEKLLDNNSVWNKISDFDNAEGWITVTDKTFMVYSASDYDTQMDKMVLSAELSNGNQSLHIRQNGETWTAFSYTIQDNGEKYLCVKETYLHNKSKNTKQGYQSKYSIFWEKRSFTDNESSCWLPAFSCFTGFEKELKNG